MGHSAGGHLALLYAYKAKKCANCTYKTNCEEAPFDFKCDRHKVTPDIPVTLVISEAGPTNLSEEALGLLPDQGEDPIYLMAGTNNTSEDRYEKTLKASPVTYANTDSPYTIYARGSNDETTKKDQSIALVKKLLSSYANQEDTVIETALINNALTNQANCAFFSFAGLDHGSFGAEKSIYPGSTFNEKGVNAVITDYYEKIAEKLQFNS